MDNSKLQQILKLFRITGHHLSLFIFFHKLFFNYAFTYLVKVIVMFNIINCLLLNVHFILDLLVRIYLGFFINTIPLFVFVIFNDIVLLVIFHEQCFGDLASFLIKVSLQSHFYHYFVFDFVVNIVNDYFRILKFSVFSDFNVGNVLEVTIVVGVAFAVEVVLVVLRAFVNSFGIFLNLLNLFLWIT